MGRLTAAFNQMLTHIQARDALLSASEARFRHLVDGVKDYAVFMLNPEGQVVTWNAGAERLKDTTRRRLWARTWRFFMSRASAPRAGRNGR